LADLFPSLAANIIPRLGQSPSLPGGFRGWLQTGAYQVDTASTQKQLSLTVTKEQEFVHYISYDFERFSLSSRESYSISLLEKTVHNLTAWPLLKLYYSAFFAAHAIMRSQGYGIVKIESDQTNYLNSIISITMPQYVPLSPGMYLYEIKTENSSAQLSVSLKPNSAGKGVHENFWFLFSETLTELAAESIRKSQPEANTYLAGVHELTSAISADSNRRGIWYSAIRNELNYQHKHDAWFPLKKASKSIAALENQGITSSNRHQLNTSKEKDPILAFANLSRYLACLNIELSEFIATRSTVGGAFGQKWRRISEQI
jgi:hypothetical protein